MNAPSTANDAGGVLRGAPFVFRLDMTPSEKVALGKALEALERPRAAARMKADVAPPERFTEGRRGQTRDIVGKAIGVSGPIYQRAKGRPLRCFGLTRAVPLKVPLRHGPDPPARLSL